MRLAVSRTSLPRGDLGIDDRSPSGPSQDGHVAAGSLDQVEALGDVHDLDGILLMIGPILAIRPAGSESSFGILGSRQPE